MKLLVLQGLPASSKTTWAKDFIEKNPEFIRVNRDELRRMRHPYWVPSMEDLITSWEKGCVTNALSLGHSVIVDATNFHKDAISTWTKIATEYNAEYELKFFDVPVVECIERDALRTEGKVGAKVIMDMWNRYLKDKVVFSPIVQNDKLQRCCIIDLDGSLALHNGRTPFEYHKCNTDLVNPAVKKIIEAYDGQIIFMSGREDVCRDMTIKWVHDNVRLPRKPEPLLYMRKAGDMRSDDIVKFELFNQYVKDKYYVEFCIDDRDKIVKLWRTLGLTCFQCNYGSF